MSQLINTMRLRGRVVGVRQIGKIKFLDVMRDHRITQLTTTCQEMVRRGDFIEAAGEQCVTRDGQIGIKSDQFKVINVFKGIHFPDRKMGDVECERHVDLLANPASNTIFRQRANIIQNLRQFLISQGFLEVETPILSKNANGAVARPFITKSVVDDADLYLRIAPELYLKRLIIGGFERVFEIGKVFRNEGVDSTHNPEFTSLELYQSFAYFEDLVKLVKVIFESLAADGSLAIKQHIDIMSVLRDNKIELDYGSELRPQLEHYAKEHDLYEQKCTDSKLFDRLVGKYVEPLCREPTIITGFPLFTSPLATASPNNPHLADRLEVYVDCKEVANGYQELTDADEQEIRFAMQQRDRDERLDMDSPLPDSDYIEALRLGMPPTIGLGIGMDRLVMLLTKQRSIKNMDGLRRVERIGRGTFGEVYKAIDDDVTVAVKVIDGLAQDIDEIQQEIRMLSRCQHPNIIRYRRTVVDRNRLWIVMDYCEMGSVRNILESIGPLPEKAAAFVGREVLQALSYLHDMNIVHRDIKSANILLTANGQVRLGDFGVSGTTTEQSMRIAGSPYWMAPEVIRQSRFDAKADIWSFGITMYELLTGNPPLWQLEPGRAMKAIAKSMPPRLEAVAGISKDMRDLVHACLHDDPDKVRILLLIFVETDGKRVAESESP